MYCFIILLYLISSFLHTKSLFIPYAYVSVESINCILLSSFELKAILLISSVKTLSLSLLNLCCVFNFSLLFINSFWSSRSSTSILFFLNDLFYFKFEMLLNSFIILKFKFSFYDKLFCAFCLFIFIIIVF